MSERRQRHQESSFPAEEKRDAWERSSRRPLPSDRLDVPGLLQWCTRTYMNFENKRVLVGIWCP
jgi:hypothetical protein